MDKKNQAEKQAEKELGLVQAYMLVFSSDHGKKVLNDLSKKCNMGYSAFNKDNSRMTDFVLGKQSTILDIQQMLRRYEQLNAEYDKMKG